MLFKTITLFGVAFLCLSVYLFVRNVALTRRSSQPLSAPVSLAAGTVQTLTFQTDFNHDYQIDVQFQPKLEGFEIYRLEDISWQLLEGQRTVAEGSTQRSNQNGSENANGKILQTLAFFKGQRGHRYELILHINRDASKLSMSDPTIVVHVPYAYFNDLAMGATFRTIIALAVAILGGLLIFVGARLWK